MAYLGNRPVSGDNNSFRVLDDIKTHTFSFDGSSSSVVSTSDDTITHKGHRLVQGQRVTYTDGTGSAIGGLTDGTVYFVVLNDANSFKLASSASNAAAGTGINLTSVGSGTAHTITVAFDGVNTKFKATFNNGTEADVTRVAQIQISLNNVIQQPQNTPTPTSGFGFESDSVIVFASAPASTVTFWGVLFANNFPTFEISDNDVDNFTGDGSKTDFTLSKSPASNENIIVTIDGVVQYPSDNSTTRAYNTVANTLQFSSAPGNGANIQVRHIGFAGPDESGGVTAFYGRTGSVFLNNSDNIVVNDAEVTGNLTVQGSMTTLDTKVTEVDQLEVAANNTTVGVAITQSGSGDILNLYNGSTERVSITSSQTRIGSQAATDTTSYEIQLSGAANNDSILSLYNPTTNNGEGIHQGFFFKNSNNTVTEFARIKSTAVETTAATAKGDLRFYTMNGTAGLSNASERLRIDSAGKVGINSTAPTSKLDVVGDVKITGIVTASSFVGALPITNDADNRIITASGSGGLNAEGGLLYDGTYFTHTGSGYKQLTASTTTNNSVQFKLQNSVKNFSITNVAGGVFQIAEGSTSRFKLQDGVSFLDSTVGVGTNTLTNFGNSQVNIEGTAALTNHDQTLFVRDSVPDDATGRGGNIGFGAYVDGTMRTLAAIGAFKKNDGTGFDGHLALYTRRNGVGPVDEVMRLESGGDVGIGTTNPVGKLHLFAETGDCVLTLESDRGNDGSNENDNPYIVFRQDGSVQNSAIGMNPNGITGESNSLVLVNGAGSGGIIFKTGSGGNFTSGTSEKMRITPDGEIRIADGGKITINTSVSGNYALQETLRIDDNNSTDDRALQIFEYHNSGARWHTFNQNLNVTTTGSSYTYTQGNYGGSNMIQMINGNLEIYSDVQVVGGGTSAITPSERIRVRSDGKVLIGSILGADPYDDRKLTINSTSNTYLSIQSGDSSFSGIVFGHASGQSTDNFLSYVRHNNSDNSFNIHTNSASDPKVTITSGGNVGIGTNNPLQKLHVADGTSANIYIETKKSDTGSTAGLYYKTSSSAASDFFKTGIVLEDDGTSHARGKLHILQNNTADGSNATLSDSVVTFSQDGKVGIGTGDPDEALHIQSGSPVIKFSDGNLNSFIKGDASDLKFISGGTSKDFMFQSSILSTSEVARITGDGNVGIGSIPDERLHVVVSSSTATVAKFERSHNNNVSIEYKNTTSRMYAGLAGDALGWAVDNDANLGNLPMFMVRRSTGYVGVGVIEPLRKLDVLGSGSDGISILARPSTQEVNSAGNASSVNNSIIIRMPYGENPATTSNAGARFGIQFTGSNSTTDHTSLNWGDDPIKSSSIYGVSEDSLGYNRKVGLAFYTSGFDATQTERLRISADGKVGIGTITPFTSGAHSGTHQLTVADNAPSMSLGLSNTDQLYIRRELANGKFTFQTVQSGGNNGVISLQPYGGLVGIGTVTPERKLDIIGDVGIEGELFLGEQTAGAIGKLAAPNGNVDIYSDGTIDFIESDNDKTMVTFDINTTHNDARIYMEGDNDTFFNHPDINQLGFTVGGQNTLRLQPGEVGIGTDNPSAPLHVETAVNKSTIAIFGSTDTTSGDTFQALHIKNDVTSHPALANVSSTDVLDLRSAGSAQVTIDDNNNDTGKYFRVAANGTGTGGTELFRVQENGNVGINETNPVAKLHIDGSGDAPCLVLPDSTNSRYSVGFGNINVSGVGQRLDFYAGDSGNNSNNLTSDHRRMSLTSQGRLGINSTSPSATLEIKDIGSTGPCILIRGATSTEGDITVPDGETFNFGHWNYSSSTFTERVRVSPAGLTTLKNFNGTGLKLEGSGSDYQGMQLQVTDASASQTRNIFIDTVNESGNAVANQVGQIQSDGGSHWSWSTQAAGDRTDRRVERVRITPDGELGINTNTNNTSVLSFRNSVKDHKIGGVTVVLADDTISGDITLPGERHGCLLTIFCHSDTNGTYPQPGPVGFVYVDVGASTNIRPMFTQGGTGADATTTVGNSMVGKNSHETDISNCDDGKLTIMKGSADGKMKLANRLDSTYHFYLTMM